MREPRISLSADTSATYAYFVPLTVLCWNHVAGWPVIVSLIGLQEEWEATPGGHTILHYLRRSDTDFHFVSRPIGYETRTVGKLARLCLPLSVLDDEEYVLLSDVDLWPMMNARAWLDERDLDSQLHLFYANAFRDEPHTQYPIAYMGARVRVWRELLELNTTMSVLEMLTSLGGSDSLPCSQPNGLAFSDERMLGLYLDRWKGKRQEIDRVVLSSGLPADRVDRSAWVFDPQRTDYVDAHLPRPGYEHWDRLRDVFGSVLPHLLPLADEYHRDFMEALGEHAASAGK